MKISSLKWHYEMKRGKRETFPHNSVRTKLTHWNRQSSASKILYLWHNNKKQQSVHLDWYGFWVRIKSRSQIQTECKNAWLKWWAHCLMANKKRENTGKIVHIHITMLSYLIIYVLFSWKGHFVLDIASRGPADLKKCILIKCLQLADIKYLWNFTF